ncbi:hypothetical protein C8R43DRAFT_1147370 [Mycena crocata]|nr:hypothetical protein C8R43DRAFT_1147370 [Mycena crocata]
MPKGPSEYTALPTDPLQYAEEPRHSFAVRHTLHLVLLLSLFCNGLFAYHWLAVDWRKPQSFPEAGYSPAQHLLTYQTVRFHRGLEGDVPIYEQPPSATVDEAWKNLWDGAASRIPKSEAVKMINDTWPVLHHEGNYIITLDVFHQLHCLDILRQQAHPGHNYTRQTKSHLRHCVGAIRQAVMCYADVTPVVWQWSTKYNEAEQRDDVLHTCRDFDRIKGWAREHSNGGLPDLSVYLEA